MQLASAASGSWGPLFCCQRAARIAPPAMCTPASGSAPALLRRLAGYSLADVPVVAGREPDVLDAIRAGQGIHDFGSIGLWRKARGRAGQALSGLVEGHSLGPRLALCLADRTRPCRQKACTLRGRAGPGSPSVRAGAPRCSAHPDNVDVGGHARGGVGQEVHVGGDVLALQGDGAQVGRGGQRWAGRAGRAG